MIFTKYRAIFGWLMTLVFVVAVMDAKASTQQDLEVALSHPTSTTRAESGIVVVTIINHSAEPILLAKSFAPIPGGDGHLMNNAFDVVDESGKKAKYTGQFIRISPDYPEHFYTRIEPGQMIRSEIDLSLDYDLRSGGSYRVSYNDYYGGVELLNKDAVAKSVVKSNVLDIWINTSLIKAESLTTITPQDNGERECSDEEIDKLNASRNIAMTWLSNAWNASLSLVDQQIILDSDPVTYNVKLAADDRYTIWQGAPVNDLQPAPSGRTLTDPDVWNHVDFLPLHTIAANTTRPIFVSFKCGCPSNFAPTVAAVARTSNPYEVNVCDFFFTLPQAAYGADSQVVVIIHELSHFSDSSGQGAVDIKGVYGRSSARALAASDHASAVTSADNFAYWVEAMNQSQ